MASINHNSHLKKIWAKTIKDIIKNGTLSYESILTDIQYETLIDWMTESITQVNMGKHRQVHQTTVHKSLFGNIEYPSKVRYGGIFNKIEKYHTGNYKVGIGKYLRKI